MGIAGTLVITPHVGIGNAIVLWMMATIGTLLLSHFIEDVSARWPVLIVPCQAPISRGHFPWPDGRDRMRQWIPHSGEQPWNAETSLRVFLLPACCR